MLEWVCPKCNRDVDPALQACPFCGYAEANATPRAPTPPASPRAARRGRTAAFWSDVDRGFRFGLGVVAALTTAYFVVFLSVYFWGRHDLVDRLLRWLPGR